MPPRIAERETIIPGDYVVIQATELGARYLAEVILVIDDDHEMFYRAHGIWPKEYDIGGYVERLAERIQKAQKEEEMLQKMSAKEKKKCGIPVKPVKPVKPVAPTTGSGTSKKKKEKQKPCKHTEKFDNECLADTRLFPDDGIVLDLEADEDQWQRDVTNCATNTAKAKNNAKTIGTDTNSTTKGKSGCCCITCCNKKPTTKVARYRT